MSFMLIKNGAESGQGQRQRGNNNGPPILSLETMQCIQSHLNSWRFVKYVCVCIRLNRTLLFFFFYTPFLFIQITGQRGDGQTTFVYNCSSNRLPFSTQPFLDHKHTSKFKKKKIKITFRRFRNQLSCNWKKYLKLIILGLFYFSVDPSKLT